MANTPNDYRDPKVTETKSSNRNWLWIALGIIAALVILALLLGLIPFGGDDDAEVVVPAEEPDAVVVEPTD